MKLSDFAGKWVMLCFYPGDFTFVRAREVSAVAAQYKSLQDLGVEVMTPPVGRRLAETVRQIQAFQVVRKSGGAEATPAGWERGQPTLKPGPELVGKVWKVWNPSMEK